jgi:hypothetical protein
MGRSTEQGVNFTFIPESTLNTLSTVKCEINLLSKFCKRVTLSGKQRTDIVNMYSKQRFPIRILMC